MINILTDGWLVSHESDHFASFSELSDEEKRIQHFIDNVYLPSKSMYRIYQKDKNIIVAENTLEWKFAKNRFFIKSDFQTLATVTPTRVYSSNIDAAVCIVCKQLGFKPNIRINKILFRQIVRKGKIAYDEYLIKHSDEIKCHEYGYSWNDLVTFTDNPKLYFTRMCEDDNYPELRDFLHQAKILNRVIKTSWSSRRIHDEHMKWTEEIHQLKTRNCSTEPIWKKSVTLPKNVILLNSEKAIADEGSNMHHCIYTNYCRPLTNRTMIAFHVINDGGDFTCSFRIQNNKVQFDQAFKAWNKILTASEVKFARSLEHYVIGLLALNPIEKQNESQLYDLDLF